MNLSAMHAIRDTPIDTYPQREFPKKKSPIYLIDQRHLGVQTA
jgi:hypothetical protein